VRLLRGVTRPSFWFHSLDGSGSETGSCLPTSLSSIDDNNNLLHLGNFLVEYHEILQDGEWMEWRQHLHYMENVWSGASTSTIAGTPAECKQAFPMI
jgi:hypothetical protein